jgi:DNA-binding CsgD family transcriptional regulator
VIVRRRTPRRKDGAAQLSKTGDMRELGSRLLQFTQIIEKLDRPEEVLDGLHNITSETCSLNVLGAVMFPLRWGDPVEKGKHLFLHHSVPALWWNEYQELSQRYPGPGLMVAQLSIAPFTISDLMQRLEPLGIERWSIELALRHGIRDSFTCPVGGRWAVIYWSRDVLSKRLTEEIRAVLFMGATFAAIRLEKLVETRSFGKHVSLTARELSVLRLMSVGYQIKPSAELLHLGEETVRTHLKKALTKLAVRNRTHAVAQAIRRRLIP